MRASGIIGLLLLCGLLQACVAVDPVQTRNEKASAVNVQLGIGYLQQNNLEIASEKLTKALRQDPESAPVHNAYAILQERLKQYDLAEYHYEKATMLDKKNAQAANNYGAFLCRHGRELESEKYFLRALDNPLYSTREYAYTNAAVCLMKVNQAKPAGEYLHKALTEKSNFAPALISMARLLFEEMDYENAKLYLDRYHLVARPGASTLWLDIRIALELDSDANVDELVQRLATDFPNSEEYKSWQEMQ
ncbi:MAG: type IV pilus biogenesis/stability protein PilW [Gammaproteobacteria bacterium]|nr:type IV pilus biogenesis/stability protein PilW [Gammaproteobacteria bacterium]